MLFDRQKRLLAFLDALGGNMGHLDFQKLLFLFCTEAEAAPSYEFVPYRFGCFSFTSHADKLKLITENLLVDDDGNWILTPSGRKHSLSVGKVKVQMDIFARQHSKLRGDELVAEVYRRYPYHATRSEIAERVLAKDPASLAAIQKVRPQCGRPGLCTIGYEGSSLENYLDKLIRNGVNVLCDVRRNPFSRKYGFSKSVLSKCCEGLGIRYEHLPQLGIASDDRKELRTQSDYDSLFAVYERDTIPNQTDSLLLIKKWVLEGARVALTCFEHLPQQCHRHCVSDAMAEKFGSKFFAVHL